MINEETKKYIPYGAGAIGGFVGNWLFNKYPKFGMVGKLVAIAGGVAGGYYISKMIVDKKIESPMKAFNNAVQTGTETTAGCKNGFIVCQQRDLFDDGTTGEWNTIPNNSDSCQNYLTRVGNPCRGRASRQRRATSTI